MCWPGTLDRYVHRPIKPAVPGGSGEIPIDSHLDLCLEQDPRLVSTRSQRFSECSGVGYGEERRVYSRCKTPGYKSLYQSHLNLARPNQARLYISLVCFLRLYPALKNRKNFQEVEQKVFVLRGDPIRVLQACPPRLYQISPLFSSKPLSSTVFSLFLT